MLHFLSRLLTALLEQEEEPSSSTYKTLVNIAATLFRSVPEPEPELFASAEPELEPYCILVAVA